MKKTYDQKIETMKRRQKEMLAWYLIATAIGIAAGIIMAAAIIFAIGTCGALELDDITFRQGVIRLIACGIILLGSSFILAACQQVSHNAEQGLQRLFKTERKIRKQAQNAWPSIESDNKMITLRPPSGLTAGHK